jgi:ABC-type sugar transport system substrate-binding protein
MPAHPEITAIVSHGAMVQGVVQGLRALEMLYPSGDPNHVYFFTIAMGPSDVAACRSGFLDGATCQSPWEQLDLASKVMLDYCCLGNDVPYDISITPYMIDQSNIDSPRYGAPAIWGSMYGLDYDLWPILDFSEAGITSRGEDLLLIDGTPGGYDTPMR